MNIMLIIGIISLSVGILLYFIGRRFKRIKDIAVFLIIFGIVLIALLALNIFNVRQ